MIKTHSHIISDKTLERVIYNAFRAGAKLGEAGWLLGEFEVHMVRAHTNAKRAIRREDKKLEIPFL